MHFSEKNRHIRINALKIIFVVLVMMYLGVELTVVHVATSAKLTFVVGYALLSLIALCALVLVGLVLAMLQNRWEDKPLAIRGLYASLQSAMSNHAGSVEFFQTSGGLLKIERWTSSSFHLESTLDNGARYVLRVDRCSVQNVGSTSATLGVDLLRRLTDEINLHFELDEMRAG